MSRVGMLALALATTAACGSATPAAQSDAPTSASISKAPPTRPWTDAKRSWINGSASWEQQRGQVLLVEAWHPT